MAGDLLREVEPVVVEREGAVAVVAAERPTARMRRPRPLERRAVPHAALAFDVVVAAAGRAAVRQLELAAFSDLLAWPSTWPAVRPK